jgi:hypothetical protein
MSVSMFTHCAPHIMSETFASAWVLVQAAKASSGNASAELPASRGTSGAASLEDGPTIGIVASWSPGFSMAIAGGWSGLLLQLAAAATRRTPQAAAAGARGGRSPHAFVVRETLAIG